MKLTNCESKEEKTLREIELQGLSNNELVGLSKTIKEGWYKQDLRDENIVIDALIQITEELGRRCK
ncbi:hypothetical protein [Anaerosalibacter sp. Marseille-P3206]|uniref:hypothetical protein n=1 Tax=Anaerosalibacter sp. Marseille-P3206 TaxID=1871005 RepID=UPI0009862D66|nr:hypothetical protein [Anaerosalibacter sp. Marseille-P3206]